VWVNCRISFFQDVFIYLLITGGFTVCGVPTRFVLNIVALKNDVFNIIDRGVG